MKTALKILGGIVGVIVLAAIGLYAWASWRTEQSLARRYAPHELKMAQAVQAADRELGQRIVTVRNGCIDCHARDLGGKTVVENGFVGVLRAPNLTPAGIGQWSDDEVAAAIRYGVGRDGRPLVIMPSHEYQYLGRDDVAAIVAYLRTVPPVERSSPRPQLGPGAKVLYALGKLPLFAAERVDQARGFDDKPAEAATAEFGRYLASSACSGCHGAEFRGGPIPGGPPEWAPAASLRLGSDPRWSHERFVSTIRTGQSGLDGHALRDPMPVKVLGKMTDTELGALWQYLSTLR